MLIVKCKYRIGGAGWSGVEPTQAVTEGHNRKTVELLRGSELLRRELCLSSDSAERLAETYRKWIDDEQVHHI